MKNIQNAASYQQVSLHLIDSIWCERKRAKRTDYTCPSQFILFIIGKRNYFYSKLKRFLPINFLFAFICGQCIKSLFISIALLLLIELSRNSGKIRGRVLDKKRAKMFTRSDKNGRGRCRFKRRQTINICNNKNPPY